MTTTRRELSDPRILAALAELQTLIQTYFPTASFAVGEGGDHPEGVYLTATVDVDDPDEVMDVIVDRLLEFEIDDELPVYVIPVRTPARLAAMLAERAAHSPLPRVV